MFENLKDLGTLDLDNNFLESISNGSLYGSIKYVFLNPAYNQISKLEALFAQNITIVSKIDFKMILCCSNMQEKAFNYSLSLKYLDLSLNNITTIKSNSFHVLINLDILDLSFKI